MAPLSRGAGVPPPTRKPCVGTLDGTTGRLHPPVSTAAAPFRVNCSARQRVRPRTHRPSVQAFRHPVSGLATPGRFSPFGRVSRSSGPTTRGVLRPLLTSASRSEALASPSVPRGTRCRPPGVSSTAFRAQPPDLRSALLMDMDFAVTCPLVRRSRLRSGSCPSARAFAPRFLQTPPRDDALALRYPSPPSGWEGTFTPQLSNMLGTQ
jgi:hypothetical protein